MIGSNCDVGAGAILIHPFHYMTGGESAVESATLYSIKDLV